jgi:hypothetical protein
MALMAGWGLILIGLWHGTYGLTWRMRFGEVFPSLLCAGVTVVGVFRGPADDLMRSVRLRSPWLRRAMLLVLTAALAAMITGAVRHKDPDWPTHLPPDWQWLWPRALYRVLLLMPVWGAWGMFAVASFCRPTDRTDPPTREVIASTSAATPALMLAIPLTGSLIYLMFLPPPFRPIPPAAAVAAGLGGGLLLVKLRGSVDRAALRGSFLLAQLAYLAGYVLVR